MSDNDPRLDPTPPGERSDNPADPFKPNKARAPRFFTGAPMQVTAGVAAMRASPDGDGEMVSQALFGEEVHVYDERDGWAWGQLQTDNYVGYVEMDALSAPVLEPTHHVTALRTYVFSEANLKSAPRFLISRMARVAVEDSGAAPVENGFVPVARAGWVYADHLGANDTRVEDWVAEAERFLGAPYLWGGRESLGCDCSGVIQIALSAAGIWCPRDSDQQEAALGEAIDRDTTALERGDLVFWPGHVGVMTTPETLLHANAHHMATVCEPLAEAEARIGARYGPLSSVRRLSSADG